MRDDSIRSFYELMTGQIHDRLVLGAFRLFTVATVWVLLFGAVAIGWYNWSKDPEQRTVRHFVVILVRCLSVGKWYFGALSTPSRLIWIRNDLCEWSWTYAGIICARDMFAAPSASRSFGFDGLHGMGLVRWAPGTGPAAQALALAS